jgi:Protein of unknown function (DUF2783)
MNKPMNKVVEPKLDTSSRFADPDAAFRALIEAHRGLSDAESASLNARLVLLLANHVGDHGVLDEAIEIAKRPPPRGC